MRREQSPAGPHVGARAPPRFQPPLAVPTLGLLDGLGAAPPRAPQDPLQALGVHSAPFLRGDPAHGHPTPALPNPAVKRGFWGGR